MERRSFRNLNEFVQIKKSEEGMSFAEALEALSFAEKPAKKLNETANGPMTTIRCANAWYEDDDGYIQNVGVFAGKLSLEEVAEVLSKQGMMYVDVYDEYEASVPAAKAARLHPGDVVDIFDVDDEVIDAFAEANGLDPEDYKHVGFFEGVKKAKLGESKLLRAKTERLLKKKLKESMYDIALTDKDKAGESEHFILYDVQGDGYTLLDKESGRIYSLCEAVTISSRHRRGLTSDIVVAFEKGDDGIVGIAGWWHGATATDPNEVLDVAENMINRSTSKN